MMGPRFIPFVQLWIPQSVFRLPDVRRRGRIPQMILTEKSEDLSIHGWVPASPTGVTRHGVTATRIP